MIVTLTVDEVKEAVADFVNKGKTLNNVTIKPEHVIIKMRSEGQHDEREDVFDGVTIDLSAASKKGGGK